MDLYSTRRLCFGDGQPGYLQHRLMLQCGKLFKEGSIFYNDLRSALAVAQDKEADVAQAAQAVQPARQPHVLSGMLFEFGGPDSFHDA